MDRQRPKSNGSSCSKGKCTGKPGSPCCVKGCCGEKQNSRHDHEKANECSNWRPSNQISSKVAKGHHAWRGFSANTPFPAIPGSLRGRAPQRGSRGPFKYRFFWGGRRLGRPLATLSCLLPLFALTLFLLLSLLRWLGSSLGRRDGLRPQLGHEPGQRQGLGSEQGRDQHQASALQTTQPPSR